MVEILTFSASWEPVEEVGAGAGRRWTRWPPEQGAVEPVEEVAKGREAPEVVAEPVEERRWEARQRRWWAELVEEIGRAHV